MSSALIVSTLSFACFRVMKKKGQKQQKSEKELVQADSAAPSADAFEEEVNSGFGNYLRSAGGENPEKGLFLRIQISQKTPGRWVVEMGVTHYFHMMIHEERARVSGYLRIIWTYDDLVGKMLCLILQQKIIASKALGMFRV